MTGTNTNTNHVTVYAIYTIYWEQEGNEEREEK